MPQAVKQQLVIPFKRDYQPKLTYTLQTVFGPNANTRSLQVIVCISEIQIPVVIQIILR